MGFASGGMSAAQMLAALSADGNKLNPLTAVEALAALTSDNVEIDVGAINAKARATYAASATLLKLDAAEADVAIEQPAALIKTITVPPNVVNSVFRITWDMKTGGNGTILAKVYKNGGAVGVEKSTASTSYVGQSDDVSNFEGGDTIELWSWTSGTSTIGKIKDFEIKGTISTTKWA